MTPAFHAASAALARTTGMTATQARGTLRLALKARGVSPRFTTKDALLVVVEHDLVAGLAKRHLPADSRVLSVVREAILTAPDASSDDDDAYELFRDID